MQTNVQHTETSTSPGTERPHSIKRHILSYAVMIVLTAIAFWLVGSGTLSASVAIPVILVLAFIQVVLQLWDFMHLSEKGHLFPVVFITAGAVLGLACLIIVVLWP